MTSQKFHSPYHFIPVDTAKTPTTPWESAARLSVESNHYVRHDFWHTEGESGRITCRIHCQTPIVIGGSQQPGDKKIPGKVEPYRQRNNGKLAIPGNSLRGMVSNLVEAISQSAMRVLTSDKETTYSVRKQARSAQNMKIGLLYKSGNEFRIYPLPDKQSVGDYQKRDNDSTFIKKNNTYQHQSNAQFVYRDGAEENSLYSEDAPSREKGILYIRVTDEASRKSMPKKCHESFILWNNTIEDEIANGKGLAVTDELIQATENILRIRYKADNSFPQLPKGYQRDFKDENAAIIQSGDLIYYRKEGRRVTELSYSAIWRVPVDGSLHESFKRSGGPNSLPWNKERSALTPAEALFGVVEDEPKQDTPARNLASRVRFSDAISAGTITLDPEITLKILASPKPPSPAMYFNSANGYVAKTQLNMQKHAPNGRKQYLAHNQQSNVHWETSLTKSDNWKPHLKCRPIPAMSEFECEIHYENLSKAELNLLLTALTPSTKFIHRLGLGKPLGLGEVKLTIEKLEQIDRQPRYTMHTLTNARYTVIAVKDKLKDDSLIDKNAYETLKTLGNPDNLVGPVSYPFSDSTRQSSYPEKEGYQWFMENEKAPRPQRLEPIKPGEKLPTLNSSHRKK